jgi:O-antigen ligase
MITNMSRSGRTQGQKSLPKLGGSAAIIGIVSAMAIVVPLLCGSSFLTNVGKVLAFEVLGAALVTFLLMNINTEGLVRRFKENITAGPNALVLAVVACAIISFAVGSTSKWLTASELARVVICAAVYFGVLYNLRGRLTIMTDVVMAVSAAAAVFGLISVGDQGFNQITGVSGSFGTHEALGSFLMLMLPITAAMGIFNKKDEKRRIAALAVSLLVTVCLAFSQSRSGWISELVALGVLALLASKAYSANTAGTKQRFIAAAPFLAFAGVAGIVVAVSGSGMDVMHRLSTFGAGSGDMSMNERLKLWHAALSLIAAKPIFGWGLGSFPYLASNYTTAAASGAFVAANGVNLHNIAHNYYLQLTAETGIVGLGLYVSMMVTFFTVGIRGLGKLKDGTRKMVLIGVLAAMAGQVVDSITSPSYNIASISLFQWMLMGIGMFAAGVPKQNEEPVHAAAVVRATASSRVKMGMRIAVAGMACLSVITIMLGTSNSAVADTYITVHHDRGVTDTDAALIGVGAGGLGYYFGEEYAHYHSHHHHDGDH